MTGFVLLLGLAGAFGASSALTISVDAWTAGAVGWYPASIRM